MIVLGIHPGHDSTAALVVDGVVGAAVAEERLSRTKSHLGFPWRAIPAVFEISGVDPREVDAIAVGFAAYLSAPPFLTRAILNPDGCVIPLDERFGIRDVLGEAGRQWREHGRVSLPIPRIARAYGETTMDLYGDALRELGLPGLPLTPIEHHGAHASSAYLTGPHDEGLVVTADGAGDGFASTLSVAAGGRMKRLASSSGDLSLGKFYAAVTEYLGFTPNRHEGKVTGLAAMGDPAACREALAECIHYDAAQDGGGRFESGLAFRRGPLEPSDALDLLRGRYLRDGFSKAVVAHCRTRLGGQRREDVAAAAQRILEECMTAYVGDALARTGQRNLILAGGLFANVKLNHELANLPGVEDVYVHPNMGDGGTALGAALQVAARKGDKRPAIEARTPFDPYLGGEFDARAMERSLAGRGLEIARPGDVEDAMAREVAGGAILGRFEGRMEYGPRALGNRSILADPRVEGVHDQLNARLRRTEFMPFAPSLQAEHAEPSLRGLDARRTAARYMTICFDMVDSAHDALPGICHVDGTTRAHLVTQDANPSYHRFLGRLLERANLSMVLNTSFNNHEEPIVCSPDDAIRVLEIDAIDCLALGPFMVRRKTAD